MDDETNSESLASQISDDSSSVEVKQGVIDSVGSSQETVTQEINLNITDDNTKANSVQQEETDTQNLASKNLNAQVIENVKCSQQTIDVQSKSALEHRKKTQSRSAASPTHSAPQRSPVQRKSPSHSKAEADTSQNSPQTATGR